MKQYYCKRRSARDWRKAKIDKRMSDTVGHAMRWSRNKQRQFKQETRNEEADNVERE